MSSTSQPHLQLRLNADGEIVVGPGKIELLEAIDRHGSIAAACRDMQLSYKKAWQLIDTMNRHLASPVLTTSSGGTRRGGALLTEQGHTLIARYRELTAAIEELPEAERLVDLLQPAALGDPDD